MCKVLRRPMFISKTRGENTPVLLGQRRARSSKRISLSTLIERAWILKMWVRPWKEHTVTIKTNWYYNVTLCDTMAIFVAVKCIPYWIQKIWIVWYLGLTSKSGKLNSIFLSSRPGLIRAGSSVSGLLVAIKTLMFPLGSKPSSWLINSSIVLWTSLSPPAPSSNRAPVR